MGSSRENLLFAIAGLLAVGIVFRKGSANAVETWNKASGLVYRRPAAPSPPTGVVSIDTPPGRNGVCVDLYDSTGKLVDRWSCGARGGTSDLLVDDYPAGRYTLAMTAGGTLTERKTMFLQPTVSRRVSPRWRFGDLDGDDLVSQAEVSFVAAHVGTTLPTREDAPEKFFTYRGTNYVLGDADLNADGAITQADVNLARASVGARGD